MISSDCAQFVSFLTGIPGTGFIFKKIATTIFKTRLSLKEKAEWILMYHMHKNGTGGLKSAVNHESYIKQKFLITKQERCTQHEQFSALLGINVADY